MHHGRWLLLLLIVCSTMIISCDQTPAPKVGFVGGFSGRYADFSMAACNGFVLAIEEQNQRGGLNGHPVEVVLKDDHQTESQIVKAMAEFADEQVAAVIGPLTSSMAVAAAPLADSLNLPLVSPSTSTSYLEAQIDCFFRVYPANHTAADQLAKIAYHRNALRSVSVIYDSENLAHCQDWQQNFSQVFEALGGRIDKVLTFSSGIGLSKLAQQVSELPSDGVFVIAGALDSAILAQQLRKAGSSQQILFSEWSSSETLIRYGGNAVEGALFLRTVNQRSLNPGYLKFVENYRARFGEEPTFVAIHSYDSTRLLLQAWQQKKSTQTLCEALAATSKFKGVQLDFSLDRFGDAQRQLFLTTVRDGSFIVVEN